MPKRLAAIFKPTIMLKKISLPLFLIIVFCTNSLYSIAQNNPPPPPEALAKPVTPMSSYEFYLSLLVLGFGVLVILFEFFLIRIKKINSDNTIKFILITLIIISTLFLITAGYSNDQIAPAIGLLGTIAGYLLGRIQNNSQTGQKQDEIADKTEIQNIKPIESSDEKNI
jgi:uncharacterized membrane protein YfcA